MKRSIFMALVIMVQAMLLTVGAFAAVTVSPPHSDETSGFVCTTCHTTHLTLGSTGYNNVCQNCHRPGDPAAGSKPITLADAANPFGSHSSTGLSRMYQTSHRWDGSDTNPAAGAQRPLQAQMTTNNLRARTDGQLACVRCHNQHDNSNGSFLRMANDQDQLCMDCHRTRNVQTHTSGSHPVGVPFNASKNGFKAIPANSTNPTADLNNNLKNGNVSCSTCHGVHFSDSRSSTVDDSAHFANLSSGDGFILRTDRRGVDPGARNDSPNICSSCHAGKKSHNMAGQDVQCADCHGAHVEYDPNDLNGSKGTNIYLIRRNLVAKDGKPTLKGGKLNQVFFRYTGSQKEYTNAQGTGVCQGCHAVPAPDNVFGYPPEHASSDPKVCNTCHFHNSTNGSFSGACTTCHGYPPSTANGLVGYARPEDAKTGATQDSPGAHVTHATGRYMACNTCHTGYAGKTMPSNTIDIGFAINGSNFRGFAGNVAGGGFNGTTLNSGYSWSNGSNTTLTTGNSSITCSNYCHGSTLTGGTITKPTWTISDGSQKTCGTCHGVTPATAPIAGSHTRHAAVSAIPCASCHGARLNNDHVNGSVEWDLGTLSGGATYKGSVSGSTGAIAPSASYGSCANVSCHSSGQAADGTAAPLTYGTPVWGGALSCGDCHKNMKTDVTAPGSHIKHAQSAGIACAICHNGYTETSTSATTHGDGSVNLAFSGIAATTSYSQGAAHTLGNGYGTCSTAYCHSAGQSSTGGALTAGDYATPGWGGAALGCGSCHKNMDSDPAAPGSHVKHAQTAAIACAACHAGYTETTVVSSTHANKNIDLSFAGTAAGTAYGKGTGYAAGSSVYATCTTSYCHSTGQSLTGSGTTPVWGGAALGCGSCHVDMSSSSSATGSHIKHARTYGISCDVCHGTGYSATSVVYPGHVNKTINLASGIGYSNGASFVPGTSYGTCSTTTCHSNGTTTAWGSGPLPADCSGCHGIKRTSMTSTTLSGKHDRHLNYSTNTALGRGNSLNCIDCHAKTVSSNTTISDLTKHVNGLADYSGARAGRSYNTTSKACSNLYCHSNGNPNAMVFVNMTGSKSWSGSGSLGCNGCHGRSNALGTPDYANGGAGTSTSNSHPNHVVAVGVTDTTGCTNCHAKTADATVAGKFKDYSASSYHINGKRDVAFKAIAGKTGSFNGTTCSATYCHGAVPSPSWGSPSLTCNSCHSANSVLPGAHKIHVQTTAIASSYLNMSGNVSTAGSYRFSCAACHSTTGGARHSDGPANSLGAAEVFFGFTSASMKGSYSYGTAGSPTDNGFVWSGGGAGCNTTYCHSNGNGANGSTVVSWSTTNSTGNCTQCHGDAATLTTGAHAKHINITTGKGLGCVECHAKTVSSNTVISDKAKHVNKVKDVGFANSPAATFASSSCANLYCHSNGTNLTGPFTSASVAWSAAPGSLGCSGCHDSPPKYAKGLPKANSHDIHAANGYSCDLCHSTVVNATPAIINQTLHVNGVYNITAGGAVTFTLGNVPTATTAARCSNISCHGPSPNAATWGVSLGCQACHSGAVDADVFVAPFSAASQVSIINDADWLTTGHGRTSGSYASGNPAANLSGANACLYCHDNSIGHNALSNPFRLRSFSDASWGKNGVCMVCHAAGSTGVVVDGVARNGSKKVASTHYGYNHTASRDAGQFCWDCHDAHGDANIYMIHDNIYRTSDVATGVPVGVPSGTAAPVVFTAATTGTDYAKSTAPFTGVCNVCHTVNQHYRSDSGDGHNQNTRCTTCHSHSGSDQTAAFTPVGLCDSCHGYPPASPGFKGTQNNWSTARIEDYAGAGGAHTINNHVSKTAKPSEQFANCTNCHRQSDHIMAPTVFRPSTNVKISVNSRKAFVPGVLARYTSNRKDGAAHLAGNCSNISCHFGASPRWDQQ